MLEQTLNLAVMLVSLDPKGMSTMEQVTQGRIDGAKKCLHFRRQLMHSELYEHISLKTSKQD